MDSRWLGRIPTNINGLSPNAWQFNIAKLPQLTFYCQEVPIPQVSCGVPEQATKFTNIPWHGDKLEFAPLEINYLVDEEMKNYVAIFNWLIALSPDQTETQYQNFNVDANSEFTFTDDNFKSDATLMILDSANNAVRNIRFVDAFPTSIQGLTFATTNNDVQYLVANVSFRYTYFEFLSV